jgi:hypothetical protein
VNGTARYASRRRWSDAMVALDSLEAYMGIVCALGWLIS